MDIPVNLTLPYEADLTTFAESIRKHAELHTPADGWFPGATTNDHAPELISALTEAGLYDLPTEGPEMAPYIGVGAVELGHACAPYSSVMAFLGGGLSTQNLVLYGSDQRFAVSLGADDTLVRREVLNSHPVPFTDSLGVHIVDEFGPDLREDAGTALGAWRLATIGYLAGLSSASIEMAIEHARSRVAFGSTLSEIEAVQHKLADGAVAAEALRLGATQGLGLSEDLSYAGEAAAQAAANAHQVLGAMGFTVEYNLQRYTRRIRSLAAITKSWDSAALTAAAQA